MKIHSLFYRTLIFYETLLSRLFWFYWMDVVVSKEDDDDVYEEEICPSRGEAGISRIFIVSRLLVWSWKMLHDMVLKINLINFFVAKDESAEKIEYLFLWSFIWLWLVGPIQTFQCSCFRRMCVRFEEGYVLFQVFGFSESDCFEFIWILIEDWLTCLLNPIYEIH